MEKVKCFFIQESASNKDCKILIAVTEEGKQYVVAGDHHHQTYLVEYEKSSDVDAGFMNGEYKNDCKKIQYKYEDL